MPRADRLRTAGTLLAVGTARMLLVVVVALTALYAAVTTAPLTELFPAPWLGYLGDVATLSFGRVQEIHRPVWVDIARWNVYIPDPSVATILTNRLPSTMFLFGWTVLLSVGGGVLAARLFDHVTDTSAPPGGSVVAILVRVVPVYFVAEILVALLNYSDRLFNFDWETFLADSTPIIFGLRSFPDLTTVTGFIAASKWAVVPAIAASTAVAPLVYRLARTALTQSSTSGPAETARRRWGPTADAGHRRHTTLVWTVEILPSILVVLPAATLIAEVAVRNDAGLSRVAGAALLAGEPHLLAALFLLVFGPALLATALRAPTIYLLTGTRRSTPRAQDRFALPAVTRPTLEQFRGTTDRLRPLFDRSSGRLNRLRENPGPLLAWMAIGTVLLVVQLGAILDFLAASTGNSSIPRLPTLVSWGTIPDGAYPTPTGTAGSVLGLPQWAAWTLRLLVAEAYLLSVLAWGWFGTRIVRVIYGADDRPLLAGPLFEAVTTYRRIGVGGIIALLIIAVGLFAPATAPAMADNPTADFDQQTVTFHDPQTGDVRTLHRFVVVANQRPTGVDNGTAGPLEYGRFDRFHPIGILLEPEVAADGGRTRDAFLPFAMNLHQLLITVGLVLVAAVLITLIAVLLATVSPRADTVLGAASGGLALFALPVGVATVRRTIGSSGFVRVDQAPTLPSSPVDQATAWVDQSLLATHHLALALLVAAGLLMVARRHLHLDDGTTPPGPRAALDRLTLPLVAYTHLVVGGIILVVVIERLFLHIDPNAVLFFDIGVSPNFTWIDTALWYRNTVPILLQVLLAAALMLMGDGFRRYARLRAGPTSHATTESDAGGDGV